MHGRELLFAGLFGLFTFVAGFSLGSGGSYLPRPERPAPARLYRCDDGVTFREITTKEKRRD